MSFIALCFNGDENDGIDLVFNQENTNPKENIPILNTLDYAVRYD